MINKKVDAEEAVIIAMKDENMPQAIHNKIKSNFIAKGKAGILSYISFESPIVTDVKINDVEYFQITFLKGEISWQQLSNDWKKTEIYYDGVICDDILAKCLVNKETATFEYIGVCNIGIQ